MVVKVTVRLGDKTYQALEKAKGVYGRNKSDIIREALNDWLERKGFLDRN